MDSCYLEDQLIQSLQQSTQSIFSIGNAPLTLNDKTHQVFLHSLPFIGAINKEIPPHLPL